MYIKRYYDINENGEKVELPYNDYMMRFYYEHKDTINNNRKMRRDKQLYEKDYKCLVEILKCDILNNEEIITKYNLKKRNKERINMMINDMLNKMNDNNDSSKDNSESDKTDNNI